jgi:AraC-like DNA-binding protein
MNYKIGDFSILSEKTDNKLINPSWILIYVRKGSGLYLYEGKLMCINESDVLLLPPSSSCSFKASVLGDEYNANVEASVICFDRQWLESLLRVFPHTSQVILALRELTFPSNIVGIKWFKLSDLMNQIQVCRPEEKSVLTLKILELISDPEDVNPISERTSPVPETKDKIAKIDRFISCNLHRKFSLEEIAAYTGMNRTYFCLFFKKHYGHSLSDYVNKNRVEMAVTMLKQGNIAVSDVANACGFPTVTYFNRVFKKIKGVTPRELCTSL